MNFPKIFYVDYYGRLSSFMGFPSKNKESIDESVADKNVDLMMIVLVGFLLIPIGLIGSLLYYFLFPALGKNYLAEPVIITYTLIVVLISNAGWALVPSILSSRFPGTFA